MAQQTLDLFARSDADILQAARALPMMIFFFDPRSTTITQLIRVKSSRTSSNRSVTTAVTYGISSAVACKTFSRTISENHHAQRLIRQSSSEKMARLPAGVANSYRSRHRSCHSSTLRWERSRASRARFDTNPSAATARIFLRACRSYSTRARWFLGTFDEVEYETIRRSRLRLSVAN